MKEYARRLTKQDLLNAGIIDVSEDGIVQDRNGVKEIFRNGTGYLYIIAYDTDENGNRIKVPMRRKFKGCKNYVDTYIYKVQAITLQRVMWAWFKGEVKAGYVVDHINNKHNELKDYRLENLQEITIADNLEKDRKKAEYIPVMPKKKKYTEEYLLGKIESYTRKYLDLKEKNALETDKKNKNLICEEIHKIRSARAIWRRKLEILRGKNE